MKQSLLALAVASALFAGAAAQERITLTTPETVPSNVRYQITRIVLQADDPDTTPDEGMIQIFLAGLERVALLTCEYNAASTPTGTTLLTGLNKANLSSAYAGTATTGSLRQRIHHRLVVLNEAPAVCGGRSLAGTLTGSVP
jgi:hypothetical protein